MATAKVLCLFHDMTHVLMLVEGPEQMIARVLTMYSLRRDLYVSHPKYIYFGQIMTRLPKS